MHDPKPAPSSSTTTRAMKTTTRSSAWFASLVLLAMAMLLGAVRGEIQCPDVVKDLTPCLEYLQGQAPTPSPACCGGATALYQAAVTREERRETCKCLKAAYLQYHVLVSAAQALPGACNLGLSYPITPDVDCDKIP